jgi:predicted kinase
MSKVLILKGLPASGKSTFARKLLRGDIHDLRGKWVRTNKDELRAMLHDSYWSKENERLVVAIRDLIIIESLAAGFNVVVDDTNLHPKHEKDITDLVASFKPDVDVKFFEIDVKEAIKRDLKRPVSVGEKVIRGMHKQFLQPTIEPYAPSKDLPRAIICDIDGTLAHMDGRTPFEWHKVHTDKLDEPVAEILSRYYTTDPMAEENDPQIIILSGRDSDCKDITEEWLKAKGIKYDHIFMRAAKDNRKDSIVKRELFDAHIRDKFQVMFILDDRDQVVEMWRGMGLKVLQVASGDF